MIFKDCPTCKTIKVTCLKCIHDFQVANAAYATQQLIQQLPTFIDPLFPVRPSSFTSASQMSFPQDVVKHNTPEKQALEELFKKSGLQEN